MGKIRIEPESCIACGDCVKVCPSIFVPEGDTIRIVEEEHCTLCGHCLAVCPTEAINHAELDKEEFLDLPPGLSLLRKRSLPFCAPGEAVGSTRRRKFPGPFWKSWSILAGMPPPDTIPRIFPFWWFRAGADSRAGQTNRGLLRESVPDAQRPRRQPSSWLQTHMRGFRLNWEYYQQGKDRIFRDAPALIFIHAPSENVSSAQNCHLAMAPHHLPGGSHGLRHLHQRLLSFRSRAGPFPHQSSLEIPKENKIYTCCTVGYPALNFRRLVQRKLPAVRWL